MHTRDTTAALQIAPEQAHVISKLMCNAKLSGQARPADLAILGFQDLDISGINFSGIAITTNNLFISTNVRHVLWDIRGI